MSLIMSHILNKYFEVHHKLVNVLCILQWFHPWLQLLFGLLLLLRLREQVDILDGASDA